MTEVAIQAEVKLAIGSRPDSRIWRNSCGFGWMGEPGNLRPIHFGLCPGSGDLIGLHSYKITAADVGKTVGVFLSAEIKAGAERPKPKQRIWMDVIRRFGGIAIVANSKGSALGQILGWKPS